MAALTFYMTNTIFTGGSGSPQEMSETAPSTAVSSPNTGWTVAKIAAARYDMFQAGAEDSSAAFGTTALPGTNQASSNALRSSLPITGIFDAGNWVFTASLLAVSAASTQRGRIRGRFYRNTAGDNTGTDMSGSDQIGTTQGAAPTTTVPQTSVITWAPGTTITLNNEYLYLVLAWEITTAGGSNSADQIFRLGSGDTRLVTPNMNLIVPPAVVMAPRIPMQR